MRERTRGSGPHPRSLSLAEAREKGVMAKGDAGQR